MPARAQDAPPADPLRSQACADALGVLDQAREARSTGKADSAAVETARVAAAQACLGQREAPLRPGRPLQPIPPAPPPSVRLQPLPGAVAPAPPSPPLAIPRPAIITHCDPAGCWAADGDHLRFVPTPALPPAGACILLGSRLHCP